MNYENLKLTKITFHVSLVLIVNISNCLFMCSFTLRKKDNKTPKNFLTRLIHNWKNKISLKTKIIIHDIEKMSVKMIVIVLLC